MKTIHNYINGEISPSKSGNSQDVFNPATGDVIGQVDLSTAAEVEAAIQNAKDAYPAWSNLTPAKRARVMFKYKTLLEDNADDIARMISEEHGKTHDDALGEIQRGLEIVDFACGIPHLLKGNFSLNAGPAIDSFDMRQSLGVCAGITPFNFPPRRARPQAGQLGQELDQTLDFRTSGHGGLNAGNHICEGRAERAFRPSERLRARALLRTLSFAGLSGEPMP